YGVCQWGMLGVLTKACSAEIVGQFALAFAVSGPLMLLTNLGLRVIQATDTGREFEFADYLGLRLISMAVACGVLLLIGLVLQPTPSFATIIGMVTLAKMFDALSDLIYGMAQQHERMDKIGISRILQGVLQCTAFAALIVLTDSLVLGTVGMAAASG